MKNKLIWIGVIVVAVGLVLPWATISGSFQGNSVGGGTVSGYQYMQSFIALAFSIAGVLASIKFSGKGASIALLVCGAIVILAAGSALGDLSGPAHQISNSAGTASIRSEPNFGIFITMLGGALIAAAGIVALKSQRE